MKRVGPDLKMPDLKLGDMKVPAVISDVYLDLRDRRLLPLIALVVVAIAAVPFLLGDEAEPLPPPPVAAQPDSTGVDAASFAVVEATPGLRAPGKRLEDREPTNPFKQRYTGLPKEARLESTASSSTTASVEEFEDEIEQAVTEVEGSGSAPGAPSSGGGSAGGQAGPQQKLELVIDVQITRTTKAADGSEQTGKMEVRRNVPVLAQLPGKKTPVTTLMGANLQTERLVFLVSHEVKAVVGEFSCVTRGEICELLEVAPGMLLEYVYEPSGARYAIKVTDARVIRARKHGGASSSRAALVGADASSAFEGGSGSVWK